MAEVKLWDGIIDIDYRIGVNVAPGAVFNPLDSRLVVDNPALNATQFDPYAVGLDLAFVKVRGLDGSLLADALRAYAYIPGMQLGQVGVLPGGGAATPNFAFADGSQFVIGDGTTDTSADDLGNFRDFSLGGGPGNFMLALGGADSIGGGPGADRLLGNQGHDWIWAGPGNDSIYGGQGNDSVFGQGGNDLVFGDLGNDTVMDGAGNDTAFGGGGNDLWIAGVGIDSWYGGQGDDTMQLDGTSGDKLVHGDLGSDWLDAQGMTGYLVSYLGAGNDTVTVTGQVGGLYLDLGSGNNVTEVEYGPVSAGVILGGPDHDDFHIQLDPAQGGYTYYIVAGAGGDDIDLSGQLSGGGSWYFNSGDGDDFVDLGGLDLPLHTILNFGYGDDTVVAGHGGTYDLGPGENDITFGFPGIELHMDYDFEDVSETTVRGFAPGVSKVGFAAEAYQDTGSFIGYVGNGTGLTNDRNFLVIDDKSYADFAQVLAGLPQSYTNRADDAFVLFLDGDAAQLWYTPNLMESGAGRPLLYFSDIDDLPGLDQLGALSGTSPISFQITPQISLAMPDPLPTPPPDIF